MPRMAFIGGSWCCGSTPLNVSLIQHPSIAGHREETLDTRDLTSGLAEQALGSLQKSSRRVADRPDGSAISSRSTDSAHAQPIRDLPLHRHDLPPNASLGLRHISYYYVSLLEAEQRRRVGSTYRIRFEDTATQPEPVLTDLLHKVFGLPFDPALPRLGAQRRRCSGWIWKPEDLPNKSVGDRAGPQMADSISGRGQELHPQPFERDFP